MQKNLVFVCVCYYVATQHECTGQKVNHAKLVLRETTSNAAPQVGLAGRKDSVDNGVTHVEPALVLV